MRQTLALCTLLLCAGGCGDDTTSGGIDMSMPDLQAGPDMAVRVPNGVVCGTMSCSATEDCCVTVSGTTTSSTCVASGGACSGGAVLACDGPEDCSTSMQYCCGTITISGLGTPDGGTPVFQGGNSSCSGTCDFNVVQGPPTKLTTRLCQLDVDCTGLTGFGQPLDKCCSSAQAPGLHFCAAAIFGITCP